MLRVPYSPPSELLHVLCGVPPIAITATSQRLSLVRQMLLNGTLAAMTVNCPKSKLVKIVVGDIKGILGRACEVSTLAPGCISTRAIGLYRTKLWVRRLEHLVDNGGQAYGLVQHIGISTLLRCKVPLDRPPREVGILCSLITGHANLQLHRYTLGITYSPTCTCLEEDESSFHYLFECSNYSNLRNIVKPKIESWRTLYEFVRTSGRFVC